jgi:hypothetical protein
MRIYGTFDGFVNFHQAPNKFKWKNVVNEVGEKLDGFYLSEKDLLFSRLKMKFGNRYMLTFESLSGEDLIEVDTINLVNKNPRCDVFRKYKDEYHIISGKYKGKKDFELHDIDLVDYCIYLGKNTTNEATIKNILEILNKKVKL